MHRPIFPAYERAQPDPGFGYRARSAPPVLHGGQPGRSGKISTVRKRFASSRGSLPHLAPQPDVKDHILLPPFLVAPPGGCVLDCSILHVTFLLARPN